MALRRDYGDSSPPDSACDRDSTGSFGQDRITRNSYDAAGQLTRVQRGWDTPLVQDHARYEYSDNGQRRSVTDANGNHAELRYDGFDRLSRWLFPSPARPPAARSTRPIMRISLRRGRQPGLAGKARRLGADLGV